MKPWYKSKTVWVNILTLLVAIITSIQSHEWISNYPNLLAAFTMILAIVNVFLRWLVDQPITSIAKRFDKYRPQVMKHINETK